MKKIFIKIIAALWVGAVFAGWAFQMPHAGENSEALARTAQPGQQAPVDSLPAVMVSPSCVGEVQFPHQYHIDELEIECRDCHHETNAATLKTPHDEYFEDFWIDCAICHRPNGETVQQAQSCANCHHSTPASIADETLSAKVVIHKSCWECHGVGTGQEASEGCAFCHTGERSTHR